MIKVGLARRELAPTKLKAAKRSTTVSKHFRIQNYEMYSNIMHNCFNFITRLYSMDLFTVFGKLFWDFFVMK